MNYKEYSKQLLDLTEQELATYIPSFQPEEIYVPFRYIMSGGGKRIRPILAMLACGAISGKCETALEAACAIEILHNFTLAHDDVMDNSPTRRGRPTVHTKWDEPTAILTGDIMVGYAYRILGKYAGSKRFPEIIENLNTALIEVCEGQAYDMQFNTNPEVSLENYILMIDKKTAALLEASVKFGGLVADATDEQIDILVHSYAYPLGIAFQIQDDLLDITADQAVFGKPTGQDILEGKKSYLILKAKELASEPADLELIDKYMHSEGLTAEYIPVMKDMFARTGVFDAAEKDIDEYLTSAENALSKLPQNQYTEMLAALARSLNKRNI